VLTLRVLGHATAAGVPAAILDFRDALSRHNQILVDFSETKAVDARFLGLLLMLRKELEGRGRLKLTGLSRQLERQFRLHGLGYLLSSGENHHVNSVH
jgi:N-acetylglucosaminyldiphosphoundecaprenol N-acetyl-beta-D-mannosaminyltransferase